MGDKCEAKLAKGETKPIKVKDEPPAYTEDTLPKYWGEIMKRRVNWNVVFESIGEGIFFLAIFGLFVYTNYLALTQWIIPLYKGEEYTYGKGNVAVLYIALIVPATVLGTTIVYCIINAFTFRRDIENVFFVALLSCVGYALIVGIIGFWIVSIIFMIDGKDMYVKDKHDSDDDGNRDDTVRNGEFDAFIALTCVLGFFFVVMPSFGCLVGYLESRPDKKKRGPMIDVVVV